MSNEININLNKLGFNINPKEGFYIVSEMEKYRDNPHIYIALKKAARFDVFAVFFRHYNDKRPSIPQIYIYDYTKISFIEEDFAINKHKRIWNSMQVPLIYVFTKTDVLIFNSYSPDFRDNVKYSLFEKINLASNADKEIKEKNEELIKNFSINNFANGSFWENEKYSKQFSVNKGAYEKLISCLHKLRGELINDDKICTAKISESEKKDIIHRLLIMSILLKYLEEKEDINKETVFPKGYFKKFHSEANSFIEILQKKGDVFSLLEDLSKHFNGEVFQLTDKEKDLIRKIDLVRYADFFEGKITENEQRSIWSLYSFNDLPIELISNIYEEFIRDEKKNNEGIVYTPPYLVNFLLDQMLPISKDETRTDIKILDPACGSGIFLVEAYKRIIYRWKIKHNWEKPKLEVLKKLLLNTIYGVDINTDAIRLTAFSLTLVLCEELNPKEIWENLKFDKLRENLFDKDFFDVYQTKFSNKFDIIIGNPPFIKELTDKAQIIANKRTENGLPPLPDNYKLSFLFLEQTTTILKETGKICLLFPADALLLRKSEFNNYFFNSFNIPCIIDFIPLRRILFKSATVATVAIFYDISTKNQDNILHIVVRRTKSAYNELFFELDKYDFHLVDKKESLKNPFLWKSHLFSISNRNYLLLKKLDGLPKFKDYLADKNKKNILLTNNTNKKSYLKIKKNILGFCFKNQIIHSNTKIDPELLSETINIYSADSSTETLKYIQNKINIDKELYKYFLLNTSNRAGLSKSSATILAEDIYNIPFIENKLLDSLSEIEKIIFNDCIIYWDDFLRKGEKSIILDKPTNEQLNEFGIYYLKILNSVYKTYKQAKPIIFNSNIIFPFYWGDYSRIPCNNKDLENKLDGLLKIQFPEANLKFNRIIRLYDDNIIYLIKPNQIRYWLPSVAIRDADETFEYLVGQEYNI